MNRQIKVPLVALATVALISLVTLVAAISCSAGSAGASLQKPQLPTPTPARETPTLLPQRPDLIQAGCEFGQGGTIRAYYTAVFCVAAMGELHQ